MSRPSFKAILKRVSRVLCSTNEYKVKTQLLGIRYLEGGVESGFNKVVTNFEDCQRLFRLRGKRNVRARQVDLSLRSMNQNDYFILDIGRKIFIYPPKNTNNFQKMQANEVAKQIRDQDHHARATVHILDHPISLADRTEFFGILGCKTNNPDIPNPPEEDDDAIDLKENATITLYNASAKPGFFTKGIQKISTQPFTQDMLKSDVSKFNTSPEFSSDFRTTDHYFSHYNLT